MIWWIVFLGLVLGTDEYVLSFSAWGIRGEYVTSNRFSGCYRGNDASQLGSLLHAA